MVWHYGEMLMEELYALQANSVDFLDCVGTHFCSFFFFFQIGLEPSGVNFLQWTLFLRRPEKWELQYFYNSEYWLINF